MFIFSDLSNNALATLEGSMFGGSSSVGKNLKLQNNNLTGLSFDAFSNVAITNIWLTNNRLTVYPQALLSVNPETM